MVTWGCSPRASSAMSATSEVSSSSWVSTSLIRTSRSSGASSSSRRATSMLVRRLVSGVRSSWEASSTSWRWLSREVSRATQQPVEGPAQAPELVGAAGVQPLGDVGGLGQLLDGVGQAVRGAAARRGRRPRPSRTATADPDEDDQPQGQGQVAELLVDAGQRRGELERAAVGQVSAVSAASPLLYGSSRRAGRRPISRTDDAVDVRWWRSSWWPRAQAAGQLARRLAVMGSTWGSPGLTLPSAQDDLEH